MPTKCSNFVYPSLLLVFYSVYVAGRGHLPLALNTSVSGKTATISNNIFTNFSKRDIFERVGLAEQIVFQFNITFAAADTVIHLSTCKGSNFDTYLVLFRDDPLQLEAPTVIAESANDIRCASSIERASLTTTLSSGTYYVLLTGNAYTSGIYNLSIVATVATTAPLPWVLDRIDQRKKPLDGSYKVSDGAKDIYVYLLDSGVNADHDEFEGRVETGYDFVRNSNESTPDCTGHGTHAAGLIAGRTYGVAKEVRIISLRVFGCNHQANTQSIINAINWILIHSGQRNIQSKSIIVMMFSLPNEQAAIIKSTSRSVVRAQIPTIVPAGDNSNDACNYFPASNKAFLTVGATDKMDRRPEFSNFGSCVDIYAPGVQIPSAWHSSANAIQTGSGTAEAAAIVTGAVALLMSLNDNIRADVVHELVRAVGTPNIVTNVAKNDSARFVYVRTVPKYEGEIPRKGFVYLFTVLRAVITSCAPGAREIRAIRETFSQLMAVEEQFVLTRCVNGKNNNVGITRQENTEKSVEIQTQVSERKAALGFTRLERSLVEDSDSTKESLGFSIAVDEMPWAVDSRNVVYWGAPLFPDIPSRSFSIGALIAIIFSILFLCSVIGASIWLIHRRRAKVDEIESMEGSLDYDRGPIRFNDYEDDVSGEKKVRSFRGLKRAVSFRLGSTRDGAPSGGEHGLNRMSSFVGGGLNGGGNGGGDNSRPLMKDMVRVESFGGEAFAAMTQLERTKSMMGGGSDSESEESNSMKSWRAASLQGENNWMLSRQNTNMMGTSSGMGGGDVGHEMMKMQSIGGEAFAMLSSMPSIQAPSGESSVDGLSQESSSYIHHRSDGNMLNEGFMSPSNDTDENNKDSNDDGQKDDVAGKETKLEDQK